MNKLKKTEPRIDRTSQGHPLKVEDSVQNCSKAELAALIVPTTSLLTAGSERNGVYSDVMMPMGR